MKNFMLFIFLSLTRSLLANITINQNIPPYPEINLPNIHRYEIIRDVAQGRLADWTNVVGVAREIPLSYAMEIADAHPEVTYFFYTKGIGMVLETANKEFRIFKHGDTVFFHGEPCWDKAYGLSDGYMKKN